MHERPAKLIVILTATLAAMVVGCVILILRAPAIPPSASNYISTNFVFEQSQSSPRDSVAQSATSTADGQRAAAAPETGMQTAAATAASDAPTAPAGENGAPVLVDSAAALQRRSAVRVLQLGDSHTAADFFSGQLRRRLQARFGAGGAGYLAAGNPRYGVRTGLFKVAASNGWTYQALQKSDDVSQFWLSGFNAVSTASGNTIVYASDTPMSFDSIEVEGVRQPHGGTIEVRLDGVLTGTFDFSGGGVEPMVFRLRPKQKPVERFRELKIQTTSDGPVVLSSVAVYNSRSGVSLSSVGFPGATISILNKFAPDLFADGLRRIAPQIVIMAFGTNEASNDKLSPAAYASTYEGVINKIHAALPSASIVIVGPPDGEERGPNCKNAPTELACPTADSGRSPEATAEQDTPSKPDCSWHQLPKLTEVRDAQQQIATRRGLTYWNWASIMPQECAAHRWVTASPPLMTPDHIHFTRDGYAMSADKFLPTLMPLVEKYGTNAGSASIE